MPLTGEAKKAWNREWARRHRGPTLRVRAEAAEARVALLEAAATKLVGRITGMVVRDEVPPAVSEALDEFFDAVIPPVSAEPRGADDTKETR